MAEGKNAHVVRKWFGHDHIPQRFANAVNRFALVTLSPFLNFHRPCLFATEYRDDKGKGKVRRTAILIMVADRMLRKLSLPFLAPTKHKNRYCGSFPLRVWLVATTVRA